MQESMSLKYEPVSVPGDDGSVEFGLAGDFEGTAAHFCKVVVLNLVFADTWR